jgi:hypothetical protein
MKITDHNTKNAKTQQPFPTEFPIVRDNGIKTNKATDGVTRSAFSKHTEFRASECGHVLPDD